MLLYLRPRLIAILFLGFVSGLPLALTGGTLSAWLSTSGVSLSAIGIFAALGTPYAIKFLWAPLTDHLRLPVLSRLGRRRGWLALTQIFLVLFLVAMACTDPQFSIFYTALFALGVATASATQDIVIDAYRVELLKPEEQGAGAAMAVLGYRAGMILSGAGAFFLAGTFGWSATYFIMAMIVPVGMVTVMIMGEPGVEAQPVVHEKRSVGEWLRVAIIAPFVDFMQRPQWLTILVFVVLFKLSDSFIGMMSNPFYLSLGFSLKEIGVVVKFYGVLATIAGVLLGGWLVYRLGAWRCLWIAGILQGASNLIFIWLADKHGQIDALMLAITIENAVGGLGTAVFVAFLSGLVNIRYTATQYALLSALASFGRIWLSVPSGMLAEQSGWPIFFLWSAALAIPGLVVLWWLGKKNVLSQ